jgi:hypothetical protein
MKTACIKIQATLIIPYDADKYGDTGRAEELAMKIDADLTNMDGVTVDVFRAKKCRVEAE